MALNNLPIKRKKIIKFSSRGEKNNLNRYTPSPPIFRRILAKIILPPTEASTWALGSHKCRKYTGHFVRNLIKKQIKAN